MAEARAQLNGFRQSPRKMRVVADLVRGKRVEEALSLLDFTPKRAAEPVKKLISSALANAKDLSISPDTLVVKEISVDGGSIMYRSMPRSRGMANRIRKRTSNLSVTLAEGAEKKAKKSKAVAKALKKEEETSSEPVEDTNK